MEAIMCVDECAVAEMRQFVGEGLMELQEGNSLDFDSVFDEIRERYGADGGVYNKYSAKS